MMTTTHIQVKDWFFNKLSNDQLRDVLYEFADELNVSTRVTEQNGRCTIASELERMEGIELGRANWQTTVKSLASTQIW
jgi:hypothetical protein